MTTAKNKRKPPLRVDDPNANDKVAGSATSSESTRSPEIFEDFPTPEQLKEYDSALEGGADRVLGMFTEAAANQKRYRLAALVAWTVTTVICFLAVVAFAIYCIYIGYNHTGLAATVLAIVGWCFHSGGTFAWTTGDGLSEGMVQ